MGSHVEEVQQGQSWRETQKQKERQISSQVPGARPSFLSFVCWSIDTAGPSVSNIANPPCPHRPYPAPPNLVLATSPRPSTLARRALQPGQTQVQRRAALRFGGHKNDQLRQGNDEVEKLEQEGKEEDRLVPRCECCMSTSLSFLPWGSYRPDATFPPHL